MKDNVVQFPKERSMRKIWADRSQNNKAALAMSLASVLVLTVFLNEWMMNSKIQDYASLSGGDGRGLASAQLVNASDIKWEHELARKLASAELARPAVIGAQPSLRDELVFGHLQGKYGVKSQGGKIQEIEFLNQAAGDQPLKLNNHADFIKKYSDLWSAPVAHVSLKSSSSEGETYQVLDTKNNILGNAEFKLDSEGRVLNFKISQ